MRSSSNVIRETSSMTWEYSCWACSTMCASCFSFNAGSIVVSQLMCAVRNRWKHRQVSSATITACTSARIWLLFSRM